MLVTRAGIYMPAWMATKARHLQYGSTMTTTTRHMHEQIRLSCQRDALHQTINTEFERASGFYLC